jgi:hypothetical protein
VVVCRASPSRHRRRFALPQFRLAGEEGEKGRMGPPEAGARPATRELDLAWPPRLAQARRAEEMKTRPPHLCPQPGLEAVTAAADRAGEGLSDVAGVELRMRREGGREGGREGQCQ